MNPSYNGYNGIYIKEKAETKIPQMLPPGLTYFFFTVGDNYTINE